VWRIYIRSSGIQRYPKGWIQKSVFLDLAGLSPSPPGFRAARLAAAPGSSPSAHSAAEARVPAMIRAARSGDRIAGRLGAGGNARPEGRVAFDRGSNLATIVKSSTRGGQLDMRGLCRALLALVVAGSPLAAAPPRGTAQFGGEETVVAVEIPVQVLLDGAPVRGLSMRDFEVLEGRKARPIVAFELVDLSVARTRGDRPIAVDPDVTAAGRRHFLLLFDLSHASPLAMSRARDAARGLVRDSLHPTDLVAVATWSYTKGAKLLIGFTSDRGQVGAAIDTLGLVELRDRLLDPLSLVISSAAQESIGQGALLADENGADPGRHPVDAGAEFLQSMREFSVAERGSARRGKDDELSALTSSFGGLAHMMSNVVGRKYVVLLSQGFDTQTVTGTTDADIQQQNNQAVEAGEVWRVNSDERFGSTRSVKRLETMLEEFRRSDCTIQSVDVGGLASGVDTSDGPVRSNRESLATLARDTGGTLYENFNDLGQAMEKMLVATSVTYVLTIQPEDLKLDGKYHELKVRLKGGPSGARLVHRAGYYAPTPYAAKSGGERQLDTAQLLIGGRPGGELAGGVAPAVFRGDAEKAHVPVVVELDGPDLLRVLGDKAAPLSFFLYAIDDTTGQVRDFVAQEMQLDLAKVRQRLEHEPLKYVADLRLPAGSFALRSLVRAGTDGAYLLTQNQLDVPAFGADALFVSEPLVPEPMTSGLVVRSSSSAERTKGLPFPFSLGSEYFLPNAWPSVKPGGSVRVCLSAYGLGTGDIGMTGELLDDGGNVVPGARVKLLRRLADATGAARLDLQLDIASSVPSGEYDLRLKIDQNGRAGASTAALRVAR